MPADQPGADLGRVLSAPALRREASQATKAPHSVARDGLAGGLAGEAARSRADASAAARPSRSLYDLARGVKSIS